jgi:hypothetical protein
VDSKLWLLVVMCPLLALATMFGAAPSSRYAIPIGLTAVALLLTAIVQLILRGVSDGCCGRSLRPARSGCWLRRNDVALAIVPLAGGVMVTGTSTALVVGGVPEARLILWPLLVGLAISLTMYVAARELTRIAYLWVGLGLLAWISWGLTLVLLFDGLLVVLTDVQGLDRAAKEALVPVRRLLCAVAGAAAFAVMRAWARPSCRVPAGGTA